MRRETSHGHGTADLAAVIAGDPAAIDRWYRAQHPVVWRLCLGFLGSATEAEDAAQDAMLKLHDRLGSWDRARPFRPWRNSLVLNLCRDRLRRREAREHAEGNALLERERNPLEVPTCGLEQRELRGLLQRAMEALTVREREAFILRELEGLTTSEVASVMSVAEGSVRSLLTLARRRLRELLGKQLPELAGGDDV